MQNSESDFNEELQPKPNFHQLSAIITFLLLLPLCFLTIPAIVFSNESKKLFDSGYKQLAVQFSDKAKRFVVSAWATFAVVSVAIIALNFISHLSLI